MPDNKKFPSRRDLDEAFHQLQDQITRITVDEEQERVRNEVGQDEKNEG